MDIVRLRSFVMVARLGHLTRAAERLCLTQPAVTAHIKAIEQELGLALFDRAPGRISLTRHGELLLPEAEHVLATVEAFAGKARQIKGEVSGNLLIATVDDSDFLRLGELLYALRGALPLLQLKTRQMFADDILDGLLSEAIDAGFHIGGADHPDIGVLPLRTLVYQAVGPQSFADPLARASWKDIAQLPWISAPERSHVARFTRTLFAQHGVRPNEAIECDQLSATLDLVRSGLGMGLLREDIALAAVEKGEVTLWPHGRIETRLNFLYRLRSESDPSIIGLLSVLRQHWAV